MGQRLSSFGLIFLNGSAIKGNGNTRLGVRESSFNERTGFAELRDCNLLATGQVRSKGNLP